MPEELPQRRTIISKQAVMAEGSLPSPTSNKQIRPTSSFFSSPRFFNGFCVKSLSETDYSVMSPTSILDNKPFSSLATTFLSDRNSTASRLSPEPCLDCKCKYNPWEKKMDSTSRGVGLGIVDALNDEEKTDQKLSKPNSRMVLFGSQLKIQIPHLPPSVVSPAESPKSPSDFCIRTQASQLGSSSFSPGLSPCSGSAKKSAFGYLNSSVGTPGSPRIFTGCLSANEMELSEDYTCIIAHGPNPRTTHIFEDCIVEDCCGFHDFSSPKKENFFSSDRLSSPSENFLSFCYSCKKSLGQGKDIYMYRGEKAFCSHECRQQEIIFEEGLEKTEMNDSFSTCS